MTRLTPTERQSIRGRAEAATAGPWYSHDYRSDPSAEDWFGVIKGAFDIDGRCHQIGQFRFSALPSGENWANTEFIAHARTDIPRLLADLDAADAEVERLRALLHNVRDWSEMLEDGRVLAMMPRSLWIQISEAALPQGEGT